MAWMTAADHDQIREDRQSHWPSGVKECRSCLGSGGDFWQHERCSACMGRGYVWPACERCLDSGEVATADQYGDYDGMEPCSCVAGQRLLATFPYPLAPYVLDGTPF